MRVLQIHNQYREPGGEDTVVRAECRVLRAAGHEVRQYLTENPGSERAAAGALAASVWNPAAAARVGRAVDDFRPDVAHVHNTWFSLSPSVLLALRRRRVPVVMTVHNYRLACANGLFMRANRPCTECLEHGPARAVRHACYRDSRAASAVAAAGIGIHRTLSTWSRLVDRFVVLSRFARERLVQAGLPQDRMVVGSNFVPEPGARGAAPSRSDEVLFVGRLSPEKGLRVLLEAWGAAAPSGLRLTVVGDGVERAELEGRAPTGVSFLGRRDREDVLRRLRDARALVIPSLWYEGQPMVALEAMSGGTPLVLSDIGGLPEVLAERQAGWLAEPGRPSALARVLAQLTDDELVDERGRGARLRYEDAFTPEAALERLHGVYRAAGVDGT